MKEINPSSNSVSILFNQNFTNSKVKIFYLRGDVIKIIKQSEELINIDVSQFTKGIYYIQVENNNVLITEK